MTQIKTIDELQVRPACEADEQWRRQLFAQLRGLQPALLAACPELLQQQWQLQRRAFTRDYPGAHTDIVLADGAPIGVVTWHEGPIAIRLLDIGLEAGYRGRGIGERLLRDLIRHADLQGKALALAVMRHNPARRLYQRLGFREQSGGDDDAQVQMRREPLQVA